MTRAELLELLADRIQSIVLPHPVRVAIDGVDGAGKTTLANELVAPLQRRGLPVIRGSIDGFHNPRHVRYRRGRGSPEGYFRDSFDHDAVVVNLLSPLGPDGSRRYRHAVFNYRTDSAVNVPIETAAHDAVLVFDGVFLHRPELRRHWDFSIFLDAPFEVTIGRCAGRDGSSPDVHAPENQRYVEGQRLYFLECDPAGLASMVIRNSDLLTPEIVRGG
jgi:uridine kinase